MTNTILLEFNNSPIMIFINIIVDFKLVFCSNYIDRM